jgi:hypothetical protein
MSEELALKYKKQNRATYLTEIHKSRRQKLKNKK